MHCLKGAYNYTILYEDNGRIRDVTPPSENIEDLCSVSAIAFIKLSKKKGYDLFALQPKDLENVTEYIASFAITLEDYDKFITAAAAIDLRVKLPKEYYSQADCFRYKNDFKLLKHSKLDYTINIKPNSDLSNKRPYTINVD